MMSKIINNYRHIFPIKWNREPQRAWLGRAINTISLAMVISMLIIWVALYVVLRDSIAEGSMARWLATASSCLAFFGGLLLAVFTGGLIGNALRRYFWKLLIRTDSK